MIPLINKDLLHNTKKSPESKIFSQPTALSTNSSPLKSSLILYQEGNRLERLEERLTNQEGQMTLLHDQLEQQKQVIARLYGICLTLREQLANDGRYSERLCTTLSLLSLNLRIAKQKIKTKSKSIWSTGMIKIVIILIICHASLTIGRIYSVENSIVRAISNGWMEKEGSKRVGRGVALITLIGSTVFLDDFCRKVSLRFPFNLIF